MGILEGRAVIRNLEKYAALIEVPPAKSEKHVHVCVKRRIKR